MDASLLLLPLPALLRCLMLVNEPTGKTNSRSQERSYVYVALSAPIQKYGLLSISDINIDAMADK